VLLLPVSWRKPVPVDDDIVSDAHLEALVRAQSPLLATALLGLPGLSVPTGLVEGLPMGVQLVSSRFREDLCLLAGEVIEKSAGRLSPPDAEMRGDHPMEVRPSV
jgi:amidase